jgi:hypothetical protein
MSKFFENLSWPMLLIMAALLGSAPMGAEPHLLEKLNMLLSGTLSKPLDMFDLLLHSSPFILLAIKAILVLKKNSNKEI